MSGVLGVLHLDGRPVDAPAFDALADSMAFRARRPVATWADGPVALACAPYDASAQVEAAIVSPIRLGECVLTADVRIDARAEFVAGLRAAGADVGPETADDALLLHAYLQWGEGFLDRLIGDFVGVLYDGRERRLLAFRDHFGARPLYYARVGDALVVSNTMRTVRSYPEVRGTLDDEAMGDYLTIGMPLDPTASAFADVRRVPGAHALFATAGTVRLRRYWSPPPHTWRKVSVAQAADEFRHLFREAVKDRLQTPEVLIGISGGLDSTSIATIAQDLYQTGETQTQVRTVVVGAEAWFDDPEPPLAREVAAFAGLPLIEVGCEGYAEAWRGPNADLLVMETDEPIDVLYTTMRELWLDHASPNVPFLMGTGGDPLMNAAPSLLGATWTRGRLAPIAREWWRVFRHGGGRAALSRLHFRGLSPGPSIRHETFLNPDFVRRARLHDRWTQLSERRRTHSTLEGMSSDPKWALELSARDADHLGRPRRVLAPFFDKRLLDWALTLPPLPSLWGKAVLREAMRGLLPESVRSRRKVTVRFDFFGAIADRADIRWVGDLVARTGKLDGYIDLPSVQRSISQNELASVIRLLQVLCWTGRDGSLPASAVRP